MPTLENVRVLGAMETQQRLMRSYSKPAVKAYTESFVRDIVYANAAYRTHADYWVEHFWEMEQNRLKQAECWWVNGEMSTLVGLAASHVSLGPEPLMPEDVPSPYGFALLEHPQEMVDVHGDKLSVAAFCWSLERLQGVRDERVADGTRGLFVSWYSDLLDEQDESLNKYLQAHPDQSRESMGKYLDRYNLAHFTPWPMGVGYDEAHPAAQAPLKLVHAFFALSQQRVAIQRRHDVDRAARRRWGREMTSVPTVRVVTLRRGLERPETDDDDERGMAPEWSHRWMVRGHWRRVWDAKNLRIRHTWVREYIKGPQDKPLVLKDQAYKLVR